MIRFTYFSIITKYYSFNILSREIIKVFHLRMICFCFFVYTNVIKHVNKQVNQTARGGVTAFRGTTQPPVSVSLDLMEKTAPV